MMKPAENRPRGDVTEPLNGPTVNSEQVTDLSARFWTRPADGQRVEKRLIEARMSLADLVHPGNVVAA
jgi:hypothetical protein